MSGLQSTMSAVQGVVTTAFVAMGAAAVAFATSIATTGINFDAMREQANVAFTTMLGSGQAAQGMLNDLQAFAAKTPFEFPDLIRASQRLMAMGFQATAVIPTLTAIGDSVAAMGGNAELVDRVTTAIGQMNAKGKASGEEMRQLTEAGIPVWQMLADKIGVTVPEAMKRVSGSATKAAADGGMAWRVLSNGVLETIPKMRGGMASVAESGVSAATAISAITEGIEKRFGGMMDAQSKTWNGIISNIKDGFQQMSGTIMQPFFNMAKEQLAKVATAVGDFSKMLQNGEKITDAFATAIGDILPPEMLDAWIKFNDFMGDTLAVIKAIITPITSLISKFVKWQDVMIALGSIIAVAVLPIIGSVIAALSGFLLPIAGVIAAVVALRTAWDRNFLGIKTITQEAFGAIGKWFAATGIWKGNINETLYGANGIQPNIIKWSNFTKNKIGEWVQWGKDRFEQFKGDVVRIFTNWRDILITTYHDWADPVEDAIGKWTIGVRNMFKHWIDFFIGDLGVMNTKIIPLWEDLLGWWADHIQPWIDYGRDLVVGLWDGIKEQWGRFTSWFTQTWNGLVHSFQEFFGINSPSTLFHGYGVNMMEGLSGGIDAGKSIVDASMAAVSNSIDSIAPKLNNYYLDLLNAKNAALQLASMPTLPPPPVLYKTPVGGPANGSKMPPSSGGAVHPTSGGPQYSNLSSAVFELFGPNNKAIQNITAFANDAYKAITAKGQPQLQGSSAASLAFKEIGTGNVGGDSVGRVISAIMALVSELQSRGVDNQVNTKAIQRLVDALGNQSDGQIGSYVGIKAALR